MPPPIPHRPPRAVPPSPPRRAAPPARPHPATAYMYDERRSASSSSRTGGSMRASPSPSASASSSSSSFRGPSQPSTPSHSSIGGYLSSGFASKARAALSSAGSYVASTASAAAAAASAASERSVDPSTGKKQTWEEWARDWRDGRRAAIKGEETLYVVPGWAVKRPRKDGGEDAFDLHVSVSGFCNFVRDPGSVSRTQRAIIGLAKRFAALPGPPIVQATIAADTLVDEPSEKLEFENLKLGDKGRERSTATPEREGSKDSTSALDLMPTRKSTSEVFEDPQQLSAAHTFMDLRLRPFWSSVLAGRRVAISMYPVPLKRDDPPPHPDAELFKQEPLVRTTFTTNGNGHFSHNVVVPWERICTHPQSLPMAFADDPSNDRTDWGIIVRAELLSEEGPNRLRPATGAPEAFGPADRLVRSRNSGPGSHTQSEQPSGAPSGGATTDKPLPYVPRRVQGANSFFSSAEEPNRNDGDGETEMGLMGLGRTMVESWTVVDISRPGGIRIISDLDDTVKHTDILSGPREVFRNVFCRDLEDSCVHGMDDLYAELHRLGLSGLHFVSNSPFELFPVVSEFLRKNNFPSYYSLKLKFYGGRSIVSSLFEPAGQRKRPSVLEIMNEFYDSRFILIGDSGEQDLELYAAIAHERPQQVAAIFIRDVTSRRVDELRRSATDYSDRDSDALLGAGAGGLTSGNSSGAPSIKSGRSSPTSPSRTSTADDLAQTVDELQQLSAAETKILRRAADWEARVARAYAEIPPSVSLVFFEQVAEIESLAKELVRDGVRRDVHPVPHKHNNACRP